MLQDTDILAAEPESIRRGTILQNMELGGGAVDLELIKEILFLKNHHSKVADIQKHIGELITSHAGTTSRRLKIFNGFSYLVMATNGYPIFKKDSTFALIYSYLLLLCTTLLYIKIDRYAHNIEGGCKKTNEDFNLLDISLKKSYEIGLISRKLDNDHASFEIKDELYTVNFIIARSWQLLLDKHGFKLNAFNNFRIVELSIYMYCATTQILLAFKSRYPNQDVIFTKEFIDTIAQSFFSKLDPLVSRNYFSLFKGQNPLNHVSFKGSLPSIEDFILAAIIVFNNNKTGVRLKDKDGKLYFTDTVKLTPVLNNNEASFIDTTLTEAASKRYGSNIIGLPIITDISDMENQSPMEKALESAYEKQLKRLCSAVIHESGIDNWGKDGSYKVLRNAAAHLPIALSLYSSSLEEQADQWIWLIAGAASFIFDKMKDANKEVEDEVHNSYKAFKNVLIKLGEKRFIIFQSDGTAQTTPCFELIKKLVGGALSDIANIDKLSLSHYGYLSTSAFACVSEEVMKLEPETDIPNHSITIAKNLLSTELSRLIQSNILTSFLNYGKKAVVNFKLDETALRSRINTALEIEKIRLQSKLTETTTIILPPTLPPTPEKKDAPTTRKKKKRHTETIDTSPSVERNSQTPSRIDDNPDDFIVFKSSSNGSSNPDLQR